MDDERQLSGGGRPPIRRWAALWTLVLGFFMILVDTTIVSVANPSIMRDLDTSMSTTQWATSAYLLSYAVPLLVSGRLGDRFGPRRLYMGGLALFTVSSLVCGLSESIQMLIAARVLQGLGAALMSPQTMAVITRIFGPRERGSAMTVWGVTAGTATLVGPVLGGLMIDAWGWEWIFFVNVPVGVLGFILAFAYVPKLELRQHSFDWLGVALSGLGLFLLVFGLQEGESFDWGVIWGPFSVWGMIISGIVLLGIFVWWQALQRGEPLVPLRIFRDRNFSVGTAATVMVGLSSTSLSLPLMFYLQLARGLSPSQAALMLAPMSLVSVVLARPVGRLIDRGDPRRMATLSLVLVALSLVLYSWFMTPEAPIWLLLIPSFVSGLGNAIMRGPLSSISTFSLDRRLAGAASGVYNTGRQIGSVLGSAGMATLMEASVSARLGSSADVAASVSTFSSLPDQARSGFASAMGDSLMLPLLALVAGAIITLFFVPRPAAQSAPGRPAPTAEAPADPASRTEGNRP